MAIEKSPLVSVIMPMYNSAQFIPQTLESLLYQTMKNFEVIVIDDCSTDNSVEVVESFKPKFSLGGGALHIIKLPKNTGTPGIPRNFGIRAARGKYIAFLDSDDLYTKTALEEMSTLAENYQADVVYLNDTYRFFKGKTLSPDDPLMTDFDELTNPDNFDFSNWRAPLFPPLKPVEAPILESDDLEERIKNWVAFKYRFGICANFSRREFLLENNITFPDMLVGEDEVFNFSCLCLSKRFLSAPNVVYIIRKRFGSVSRDKMDVQDAEKYLRKWVSILNSGFNELEKFMARIPFFKTKINYRHAVLELFFYGILDRNFTGKYLPTHSPLIYQYLKKEFHPANAAFTSFLFDLVNIQRLRIINLNAANEELKRLLQEVKEVLE